MQSYLVASSRDIYPVQTTLHYLGAAIK